MENNKEYIVNIRVSKDTYDKLKRKAKENSQTISNIVRKTLDDSYEVWGDLKKDLFGDKKENSGISYYQKVVMAKDEKCERCDSDIGKGDEAYVGETKSGSKKYFCNKCFLEK